MALDPAQRSVIRRALRTANHFGASPRERKALIEALSVESNFRNLPYGDRDSTGALQQRPSQGWGPAGEPLETDVTQFLTAARKAHGVHGSAGVLAQAVQRSAFPGRYDRRSALADALLHGGDGGGQQTQTQGSPAVAGGGFQLSPGADVSGLFAQLLSSTHPRPVASAGVQAPSYAAHPTLPSAYQGIQSSGGPAPRQDVSGLLEAITGGGTSIPGVQAPQALGDAPNASNAPTIPRGAIKGGVAKFEGTQVAAWIKPILKYARQQGWRGQVTSGFRTREQQAAIYNSGVRPAARPGTSNHEATDYPRGAVDVSDAQQLAAILRDSPYRNRLRWAGSKDPVHFSHPVGGHY